MKRNATLLALAFSMTSPHVASAGAIDDIKIEASHDPCEGQGANDNNYIVYASNLSATITVDATFRYDSNPSKGHFILFDADLNPVTDRFPKVHTRRLRPHESVQIGCSYTYRAAPTPPGPLRVPLILTTQTAAYVDANTAEPPSEDARSFAAFILQGGNNDCGSGAKPPGLFFLLNLHPYARLSVSLNWLDDRGTRIGAKNFDLPPLSTTRLSCSNGPSKPGAIASATLEWPPPIASNSSTTAQPETKPLAPERREPPVTEAPALQPLSLGQILRIQNICAGSVPPGWIKINDAWNPTVCGNPATITYNVWTIQQFTDQPIGAVIQVCNGIVPAGWAILGTGWNPTVCGHPTTKQSNVMALRRLN